MTEDKVRVSLIVRRKRHAEMIHREWAELGATDLSMKKIQQPGAPRFYRVMGRMTLRQFAAYRSGRHGGESTD